MASKRADKKNLKEFAEKLKTSANILKRNTSYAVDQTVNKGQIVLKCTLAGTTDKEALNLSTASVGNILGDGTVEWEVISITGYGSGSGGTTIADWDTNTAYEAGDLVIYDNSLYQCLIDHTSTSTFDGAKWQVIGNYVTAPIKIGDVGYVSWQYTLLDNHLALDGSTVNNFAVTYPELFAFFTNNSLITSTQATYDSNKSLLLYNSSTDTATMPNFLDKTVWGGSTIGEKSAGLPNIKGMASGLTMIGNSSSLQNGAFTFSTLQHNVCPPFNPNSDWQTVISSLDASQYNSIYSDSINTVQPPAIQLIPQIRYKKDSIDGTIDIYNNMPLGTVISYMGTTPPKEYLACDGTIYNINDYIALAEFIKDEFGSYNYFGGNGTSTFAVPDLRGEFLRGTGTNSHTNNGDGSNVGVHQDGTEIPNVYAWTQSSSDSSASITAELLPDKTSNLRVDTDYEFMGSNTRTFIGVSGTKSNLTTGTTYKYTTRPTNTSVLYCIKYTNSNPPKAIQDWITSENYEIGDFVVKDNQIYRANTNHTSTTWSADIAKWTMISGLQSWTANTTYKEGSLLYYAGKLYKVTTDFTSTSTFNATNLELVGGGLSEWKASTSYRDGDIVVYNGEIYKVKVDYISASSFSKEKILEPHEIQTGEPFILWAENLDVSTGNILYYNTKYFTALKNFTCGEEFSEYALEEYVPKPLTEQQIEDIIRNFNPMQSGSTGFVVVNSAPAHNALYRGKDLTDYFNSGEMSIAIANGSFENIFPGDYVIKSVTVNGTTYADTKWISNIVP